MRLSTKQINELITGVQLALELKPTRLGQRHFISVAAYDNSELRPDKIINDEKKNNLLFWIRDYEVPIEYIENDWEIPNEVYDASFYI